jgi:hypothetical protein
MMRGWMTDTHTFFVTTQPLQKRNVFRFGEVEGWGKEKRVEITKNQQRKRSKFHTQKKNGIKFDPFSKIWLKHRIPAIIKFGYKLIPSKRNRGEWGRNFTARPTFWAHSGIEFSWSAAHPAPPKAKAFARLGQSNPIS